MEYGLRVDSGEVARVAAAVLTRARRAVRLMTDMTLLSAVPVRRGHFRMESGYHTDLWMHLETLCRHPALVQPAARALADKLRPYRVDAVCGPLTEGAFVALMVAGELGCDFTYAERFPKPDGDAIFPVQYALPKALRPLVAHRRVAIVNDVVSAGSAVRGAFADLNAHGAQVVAIGCLMVLGDAIDSFAANQRVAVESLERSAFHIWSPADCPLCRSSHPCESVG
jgi:orotate phosphoribosyltransferase